MKNIDISELEERVRSGAGNISDYFDLGSIYLVLGHYDKLFDLYNKLKSKELLNIELARVFHEEGEAFLRYGKLDEAKISFEESMRLILLCDDSLECLFLKALNNYKLFLLENDPDLTHTHANEALNNFKSLIIISQYQEDNCKIHSFIADIYSRIGDLINAMDSYNTALNLAQTANEKLWIISGMASIYAKTKEYKEAIKYFNNALQLADKTTPISKIYFDLGVMYFDENRLQDAKQAFQEALRTKIEDVAIKDNPEYEIDILWHLGTIAYNMEDNENVAKYLNEVLKRIKNNHYYYSNTHLTLGHYYLITGGYEKAREHYNHVITAPHAYDDEIRIAKHCLKKLPLDG